jgi:hypothetical protein
VKSVFDAGFGVVMRRAVLGLLIGLAATVVAQQGAGVEASSAGATGTGGSISCNLERLLGTPGYRSLPPGRSPTRISIMPSRYWDLENTALGLRRTGTALITIDGNVIGPAGSMDDVGSYYFIPELSVRFSMPVRRAVDVFYLGLIAVSLIAGAWGFFLLFKEWPGRIIVILGLLMLAGVASKVGDVYIFYFVTSVVAVPWILVLARRQRQDFRLPAFLALMGVLIAFANWVRGYSGTGALLFVCGVLVLYPAATASRKAALLLCLGLGLILPSLFFSHLVAERDKVVRAYCPGYAALWSGHSFWHPVYTGLGFLQNDYGLRWDDTVTYDKVQTIAPGTLFGSPQYDKVLKEETIVFAKHHPWFIFMTLASKIGVTLAVFLLAANVGLAAAVYWRKPWGVEIPFWLAILFSSVFSILVYPLPQYMLGLITFGVLYAITSIGFGLERPSERGKWQPRSGGNQEAAKWEFATRQPERQQAIG